MDKDIAVLIIHVLIKQLGMQGAGSREQTDNERRTRKEGSGERKTDEEKELKMRGRMTEKV